MGGRALGTSVPCEPVTNMRSRAGEYGRRSQWNKLGNCVEVAQLAYPMADASGNIVDRKIICLVSERSVGPYVSLLSCAGTCPTRPASGLGADTFITWVEIMQLLRQRPSEDLGLWHCIINAMSVCGLSR